MLESPPFAPEADRCVSTRVLAIEADLTSFHILRTGAPWRDLPERYGPRTTVYNRYNCWAKAGGWLHVFEALAEKSPHSPHLIDSFIVRAHQDAADGKRGARITPSEPVGPLGLTGDVVGDRGHFGQAVITAIEASGATAQIPSQSNVRVVRTVDRTLYRERYLVERFFNRLKHFRGIATRYFKTATNFLGAIHLASARLWIRHNESAT